MYILGTEGLKVKKHVLGIYLTAQERTKLDHYS